MACQDRTVESLRAGALSHQPVVAHEATIRCMVWHMVAYKLAIPCKYGSSRPTIYVSIHAYAKPHLDDEYPTVGSYAPQGMKGREPWRTRRSEGVVSPKLALRPSASFAFASAMSFRVITPMTCMAASGRFSLAALDCCKHLHESL